MKLNRKWLMVVALVLSMAMATGGTLAYLTDQDADKNTMTLGKVEIVQNEHQRAKDENGDYKTDTIDGQNSYVLEVFENDKPLLPATEVDEDGNPVNNGAGVWDPEATVRMTQIGSYGGMDVFTSENAQDKFVTVTNTGRTDAYVRTIIAYEAGDATAAEWDKLIGLSHHFTWDTPKDVGIVNIDGTNYMVVEYVYKGWEQNRHVGGVLPAGETTYPSLAQVYMKSVADNEDVEKLDGNDNGKYDILVLSQAVQADGFDDAATALKAGFGEVNAANVQEWFGKMEIGSPGDKNQTNDVPEAKLPTTSWLDNADTSWYEAGKTEYTVSTAAELAGLSKLVYEGNTFSGKTITLDANVNLEDHLWMPIGRMVNTGSTGENSTFKGTFIGNDNTVSNLFVDTTDAIAGNDNDKGAGLFGAVRGTIKNVTVDKAIIKTAHWGAAIAGNVEVGGIENCHAKNVTIECLPELINGSYDNGDKSGAIAGYISEGAAVENCTVTNAEITGYRDIGGVVGYANANVTGCTISNVTLNLDKTNNYKNYSSNDEFDLNSFVGETGSGKVTECTGTATINYGN